MKLCCDHCFSDKWLKKHIIENGGKGYCDFCEEDREYCIEPSELQDLFRPVINLYAPVEEIESIEGEEIGYTEEEHYENFLWEMLQNDWKIFSSNDSEINEKLIRAVFLKDNSYYPSECFDLYVYYSSINISDNIRYRNWWKHFSREIKHENRFFPQIQNQFLENIDKLLTVCVKILEEDSIFYRARSSNCSRKFSCDEMGKPPLDKTLDGRGNPQGIAYLYLASNENTAVSEINPYINDIITIGKFVVDGKLSIIDLRNPQIDSPFKYGEELEYYINNLVLLKALGLELSRPINIIHNKFNYLPTQYLCELIKSKGYDGLVYNSFLGDGYNILFYNDKNLKCVETWTVEIKNIKHEYHKVDHRLLKLDREIRGLYYIKDNDNGRSDRNV